MPSFPASEGRRAFGSDPANYDRSRPAYTERVFDVLRERCGLGPGVRTFEVGAGTGRATRRLLELGASPLVAVEPDERMAAYMREHVLSPTLQIIVAPWEEADLGTEPFDLGVAATSFHWVDEPLGLAKAAGSIRPGGWWAMWWQIFGDDEEKDAFYHALDPLLSPLPSSPSSGQAGRPSFALDVDARLSALAATGAFEEPSFEKLKSRSLLDPSEVRRLYASFSDIGRLPDSERTRVLEEIERIAREEFGGQVERTITTTLYTARRAP
jgi:SAM-dependent methyltransferase